MPDYEYRDKKSSPDLRSELDPYGIPIKDRYMYVPAFA